MGHSSLSQLVSVPLWVSQDFFFFFKVYEWFAGTYICKYTIYMQYLGIPEESWIPCTWCYKASLVTMWMLGNQTQLSVVLVRPELSK